MIAEIPEILTCGEECSFLCVFDSRVDWYVLGWDNEDNTELANKVLKAYFSEYKLVTD